MIRMITLILPLCCLFNPERHELARGIYIIREVYIAMFVIRITKLTIAFNHSYHTCKFDIDWISILKAIKNATGTSVIFPINISLTHFVFVLTSAPKVRERFTKI